MLIDPFQIWLRETAVCSVSCYCCGCFCDNLWEVSDLKQPCVDRLLNCCAESLVEADDYFVCLSEGRRCTDDQEAEKERRYDAGGEETQKEQSSQTRVRTSTLGITFSDIDAMQCDISILCELQYCHCVDVFLWHTHNIMLPYSYAFHYYFMIVL